MRSVLNTNNKTLCLYVTIRSNSPGPREFRCVASDTKKNSKYADRCIQVNGERTIYFSFPVSPRTIIVDVFDKTNPTANDFVVALDEKPLKQYGVWIDEETTEFIQLATYFSQTCGFSTATPKGRIYATSDALGKSNFAIKYFDVIRHAMTQQPLGTPARIGHRSGIIEVSKQRFDPYTIPMRMCILFHEYSHKYRNPKMGLPIQDEVGADINGLYMYLGLGFSKVDAIYVYANVFLKAQTPGNIDRMRKIVDYIQRFQNQEFAQLI